MYNHEKYIEDAIKGIVMQKTDFPFLAVVIDDCSTDGTADIVRRYETKHPGKIKGIYLPHNFTKTRE
jgi:glycosyltransferase involved in cell wall biosynthesis